MDKTKEVNRLFVGTVLWALFTSFLLAILPFGRKMGTLPLMLLSQVLYLAPVAVFLAVKKIPIRQWVPFQPISLSAFAGSILYTLLLEPLVIFLNLFSMLFVDNAFSTSQSELAAGPWWVNLLVIALIPALFEEFTFRGIYYHGYRQRGVVNALIGSALAFALMHMNFNQFCYALAVGIAFGFLLEATGSIAATMTGHFVLNGISVLSMAFASVRMPQPTASIAGTAGRWMGMMPMNWLLLGILGIFLVIALAATALAVAVLIWIARSCGRTEHLKWCVHRHGRLQGEPSTMLTPSFVVGAVITLLFMVWIG